MWHLQTTKNSGPDYWDLIEQTFDNLCDSSITGGETLTSNSKALLTKPLPPLVMDKKNRAEAYRFLTTDPTVRRKSILETPQRGRGGGRDGVGVRQLRSHVNTNTNLREENRTVHCSRKRVFHIMNKKRRGHSYTFSQKGEPI